ncbi:adenylosuccinate lyase family protein [Lentzea tibetensis]|uniref:Adenylosuccinate lyase family protein n=1 Tax=Lentzea tibetensis TaxID=2591470 RepID=A0A563ERX9_9PSEU|nr:adenylosuccinate lyase family protein [Lentzea tibetensis]TWP50457.1 adenylosuccinate lyase family protein [Lentzea tibetensis]
MSDLFGPLFGNPAVDRELSSAAWVRAMLDFERALFAVSARAGIVPPGEFPSVEVDPAALGSAALASGNPVVPLVSLLRSVQPWAHHGATSQDVLDTAMSLVARRALAPLRADLAAVASSCARLAAAHRDTVMAGRTLYQQAVPTTFGLKCAGWLVALDRATERLCDVELAVQFGGAAGTLAVTGDLVGELAAELDLSAPLLPWHTDRTRVADLACALGTVAGVLGKIAGDVLLLSQTEVGEVAEGTGGGSSAMPHKQNPTRSVLVSACTRRTPGLVQTLLAQMPQEHERAGGAWHAEWETVTELLRLVGGAALHARELLAGLRVDGERMRHNLGLTEGLVMSEHLATVLGRATAQAAVAEAARTGKPLRDVLLADPGVSLDVQEIDRVLDPGDALGSAGAFVDRVLAGRGGEEAT